MSKEFIEKFVNQKKRLKQYFEREKTGVQTLYTDQAKLFEPLINSQKETQNKIVTGQESLSNALVPLVQELQKRNDQVEALQGLPFYNIPEIEGVPQSTPKVTPQKEQQAQYINVDLDGELLNQTHQENLQDMGLDLPSGVQKKGTYETAMNQIKTENRRIAQYLREDSKKSDKEKDVYKSRKQTLEIYKNKINAFEGAKQFIVPKKTGEGVHKHKLVKQKRGRGRPKTNPILWALITYKNPDDLVAILKEYILAKDAGNTGLDNYINEILDE